MSWKDSAEVGNGRSSIWLHPQMLMHFKFEGSKSPTINEDWLKTLTASADSSRGLVVTGEFGGVPSLAVTEKRRAETTLVQTPPDSSGGSHRSASPGQRDEALP